MTFKAVRLADSEMVTLREHKHFGVVQSAGRTMDDGRIGSLIAFLNVVATGSGTVYYRENGMTSIGASNSLAIGLGKGFVSGWHSLDIRQKNKI